MSVAATGICKHKQKYINIFFLDTSERIHPLAFCSYAYIDILSYFFIQLFFWPSDNHMKGIFLINFFIPYEKSVFRYNVPVSWLVSGLDVILFFMQKLMRMWHMPTLSVLLEWSQGCPLPDTSRVFPSIPPSLQSFWMRNPILRTQCEH